MSHCVESDQAVAAGKADTKHQDTSNNRWNSAPSATPNATNPWGAAACCILATLAGSFAAMISLGEPQPQTTLVSLYLAPPDSEACGIGAPYPPYQDKLFGLTPINLVPVEKPDNPAQPSGIKDDTNQPPPSEKDTSDPDEASDGASSIVPRPSSTTLQLTDWRKSLEQCRRATDVILHVSSFAKVEHDQLILFGQHDESENDVALPFSDVLGQLQSSPAARKLLVLEIHWPLRTDEHDSSPRLTQINALVERELERVNDDTLSVLLSSDGSQPSRGSVGETRSLLSACIARSLTSLETTLDHDGRATLDDVCAHAQRELERSASRTENTQRLVYLATDVTFHLPALEITESERRSPYPDWLAQAWHRRDSYVNNRDLPWVPEVAKLWSERLAQLECGWRRGVLEEHLQAKLARFEADLVETLDTEIQARCDRRPDSLLVAADRDWREVNATQTAALEKLLSEHEALLRSTPQGDSNPASIDAAIAKLVTEYTGQFKTEQASLGLAMLLNRYNESTQLDKSCLTILSLVIENWKDHLPYPVVGATNLLRQQNLAPTLASQYIRLHLAQNRIGNHRTATSLLSKAAATVSAQLAETQRLIGNPAMTSDETIAVSMEQSLASTAALLSAEQSLDEAFRRLDIITMAIASDERLGLLPSNNQKAVELVDAVSKMVAILEAWSNEADDAPHKLCGRVEHLRQASDRMQNQWQIWIQSLCDETMQRGIQTHVVSTAIPVASRMKLFQAQPVDPSASTLDQSIRYRPTSNVDDPNISRVSLGGAKNVSVAGQTKRSKQPADRETETPSARLRMPSDHDTQDDLPSLFAGLQKRVTSLKMRSDSNYDDWYASFITSVALIESNSFYRQVLERVSVPRRRSRIPVSLTGTLHELSWDQPNQQVKMHYRNDTSSALPVHYEFYSAASENVQISPQRGTLRSDEKADVHVSLSNVNPLCDAKAISGIWLKITCGDSEELVPLRFASQPSVPVVDIDFGQDRIATGREVTLSLWPGNQPQNLDWKLRLSDPTIKSVIVSVQDANGIIVESAPVVAQIDTLIPIRLPFDPKNNTLISPLSLIVRDAEKQTHFGRWTILTRINDPRDAVEPGWAEFSVDPSGQNRLSVELRRTRTPAGQADKDFTPTIAIELDRNPIPHLIDFGASRTRAILDRDQHATQLHIDDIRIDEAGEQRIMIPLTINGDPGYFELEGNLTRSAGISQFTWNQTPTIKIVAPEATTSTGSMRASIRARNLDDSIPLLVEVLPSNPNATQSVWQTRLDSPREPSVTFNTTSEAATFAVTALRRDWSIEIPTEFGSGPYRLRVSTLRDVGSKSVVHEHSFLIDDESPRDLHARATIDGDQTTLFVRATPSASGIALVSMEPESFDPNAKKSKPVIATKVDTDGAHWRADWPKSLALPERLAITSTTGAGKTSTHSVELAVQTVDPIGTITGKVLEGSIGQPNLVVQLRTIDGAPVARVRTQLDGTYSFVVAPGTYLLECQKPATGRSARAQVFVETHQTEITELKLLRST